MDRPGARPHLGLPDRRAARTSPSAAAVLAEINGWDADGEFLSAYTQLKDDGSTSCGCWIYCGCYADGVNQTARRKPAREQNWTGGEWAWAWPANRRILYNRASADPQGKPWSERKALVWWDAEQGKWTGHDTPDFEVDKPPDYRPADDAVGPGRRSSGTDPFIMQADGRGWLYAPAGRGRGPAADALRAPGLAGAQPACTASSATRRARSTSTRTTATTPIPTTRARACSRSSPPPTG